MNIILTIAANPSICESLRAALPKSDLVLFENTVEEALRRLISVQADAIVLDDGPRLGLNALEAIVQAMPTVPVIVLSSRSGNDTLAAYTLAGARRCLAKPFQCEDLIAALGTCINPPASIVQFHPAARTGAPPHGPAEPGATATAALHQHQMALRWMARNTTHIEDATRLTQGLVDTTIDIFDAIRAAVLLQTNGTVRIVASHGIQPQVAATLRLTFTNGLMRRLEQNPSIVALNATPEDPDALKQMRVLGATLAVPLASGGRICGAIVIGGKASGMPFTLEERELMTLMARYASTCLDKARQNREASHRQNRLDVVLANIQAGVVTIRPDKTISMMNESAERILQIHAKDVLGQSVQKLGSTFADVALTALAKGEPQLRRQIRDYAIDATLGLSATPIGQQGVAVIFSILSEQREAESDITYNPIWEYLASRAAQEIKNPLVAINTFAQLLPSRYESQEFREDFAKTVQKEVARIGDVVETFFEFANHPRLAIQSSDLNESVRHVLEIFEAELKARSITLETKFETDNLEVRVDPALFSKAVSSIVRNSIEAMPDGGTLKVSTAREKDSHEVIIEDTGPGISEKDAPLVFQPFYSTKEQGMGLGLTMANRIMKQHEGDIELLHTNDGGGAFALHLPWAV